MNHTWLKKHMAMLIALFSIICVCLIAVPSTLAYTVDTTKPLVNTFAPGQLAELDVPVLVKKTVLATGETTISPEGFQFQLLDTRTGEKYTAVSNANGQARFLLNFAQDEAGSSHSFLLTEINDGRQGVTYSDLVYSVDVKLEMVGEELTALVSLNDVQVESCVAAFENIYNDGAPDEPDTGDAAGAALCAMLLLISAAGIVLLLKNRQRVV